MGVEMKEDYSVFDALVLVHALRNYEYLKVATIDGKLTDPVLMLQKCDSQNLAAEYAQSPNQATLDTILSEIKDFRPRELQTIAGANIQEGVTEVPHWGYLIISNGDTLPDRMNRDGILKNENKGDTHKVSNLRALMKFLAGLTEPDGAYLYDSKNRTITKVLKFLNEYDNYLQRKVKVAKVSETYHKTMHSGFGLVKELFGESEYLFNKQTEHLKAMQRARRFFRMSMKHRVCDNFVYEAGDRDFQDQDMSRSEYRDRTGLKTKVASGLAKMYGVDAYQIKRTSFSKPGYGVVTHFNDDGLVERAYFKTLEDASHYVDAENKVAFVYERFEYDSRAMRPKCVERKILQIDGFQITKHPYPVQQPPQEMLRDAA
jgi:hypothetical protein